MLFDKQHNVVTEDNNKTPVNCDQKFILMKKLRHMKSQTYTTGRNAPEMHIVYI